MTLRVVIGRTQHRQRHQGPPVTSGLHGQRETFPPQSGVHVLRVIRTVPLTVVLPPRRLHGERDTPGPVARQSAPRPATGGERPLARLPRGLRPPPPSVGRLGGVAPRPPPLGSGRPTLPAVLPSTSTDTPRTPCGPEEARPTASHAPLEPSRRRCGRQTASPPARRRREETARAPGLVRRRLARPVQGEPRARPAPRQPPVNKTRVAWKCPPRPPAVRRLAARVAVPVLRRHALGARGEVGGRDTGAEDGLMRRVRPLPAAPAPETGHTRTRGPALCAQGTPG